MEPLRLIVCDIEGCLTPGKGMPMDLTALEALRRYNVMARDGSAAPLTLCTGRPQPFVEVFCQALEIFVPAVCENGAFLYDFVEDRLLRHPDIGDGQVKAAADLRRRLADEVSRELPHRIEPGKEICISLNPVCPPKDYAANIEALFGRVVSYVDSGLFTVTHSASAVDITPAGIDKAAGVRFLAERTGIPLEAMLGIGDTEGDLPFLRVTGRSAAPENGAEALEAVVDFVADAPGPAGVKEIVSRMTSVPVS